MLVVRRQLPASPAATGAELEGLASGGAQMR
jgi:hypothetical protein